MTTNLSVDLTSVVLEKVRLLRQVMLLDPKLARREETRLDGSPMALDTGSANAHKKMLGLRKARKVEEWRDVLNGDLIEVFAALDDKDRLGSCIDALIADAVAWREALIKRA